ncbi:siphovirus ReqiPepy6 Gp37-like family protein [Clostridium sporogenes]|uniref:siphovirus ReqiPepy6 Gp37-like family protein n=1 Tax=Clostridium sporogenes TaxID=1509 RepID=UPI000666E2A6|nr:siphovirus ReqiPepy6 Gp37-like family protein [Clostridium sporogenes]
MEIYIFDKDLKLKGVLDSFISLRWVKRYSKSGDFQLNCVLNEDSIKLLQRGNIIFKKGDNEAGYIETRQLSINSSGNELLEIKGKFLTNYLNRRISWGRICFDGSCKNLIEKLINENVINPSNIKRKIPNIILGNININNSIQYNNSFGNILEQLEKVADTNNFGFRNILDIKNRKIIFEIYKGVDRTINNGTVAPCIFSREFENILQQQYIDSINNYKNTCLIAGAGEGSDRKITSIEEGEGLDRYEFYVDARDLQDKEQKEFKSKDAEGNETIEMKDVEIPWERYKPLLIQRGKEKLSECKEVQSFDAKINIQGNNVYKKDFNLGDIITVRDKKWRLTLNRRITEIEEIYESKGVTINVILGNSIPSIIDKIKQQVVR